jgi:hypothetical protein
MEQGGGRDARVSRVRYWMLHLVPAGLLVSALDPWPYGYYTLLRFVVSIAAVWLAFLIYRRDSGVGPWSVVFVSAAVLFNPVIPVDLPRDIWIVYVATAALFLVHLVATRTEPTE